MYVCPCVVCEIPSTPEPIIEPLAPHQVRYHHRFACGHETPWAFVDTYDEQHGRAAA
jgi:hypothetical protein